MWRTEKFWRPYIFCYGIYFLLYWICGFIVFAQATMSDPEKKWRIPGFIFEYVLSVPLRFFVSEDTLVGLLKPPFPACITLAVNCFIVFSVLFYLFRLIKRRKKSK